MKDLRVKYITEEGGQILEAKGGAHLYEALENGATITAVEAWADGELVDVDKYIVSNSMHDSLVLRTDPVLTMPPGSIVSSVPSPLQAAYSAICDGKSLCGHGGSICNAGHTPTGYYCTREVGHSGDHVACNVASGLITDHNLVAWGWVIPPVTAGVTGSPPKPITIKNCINGDLCSHRGLPYCHVGDGAGFSCTRLAGHRGPHVACGGGGDHNLSVWQ